MSIQIGIKPSSLYCLQIINTRFNGIRPATIINAPIYESTLRGRGRGRGRGRPRCRGHGRVASAVYKVHIENVLGNKNCHVQDEEIEDNKDFEDVEKIGRKGGVLSRNIGIPPFQLMLAQHIMLLLKGLAGQVILPSSQPPYNPPVSIIVPMLGETIVNDAFFHPLLVSVVTQNMHGMLTMFLKLNPLFFLGS